MFSKSININEFNYELSEDKIAKFPLSERSNSKLLVYKNKTISETTFKNIKELIPSGSLLVFNNTKVIKARLIFKRETGSTIEIFCLEPHSPADYYLMFQEKSSCQWKCMVGNLKKWKEAKLSKQLTINNIEFKLEAEIVERIGKEVVVKFSWNNSEIMFGDILEANGQIPIPPYLKRESEKSDEERYQTIYSKLKGSVAAPTAGLHFTDEILNELQSNNVELSEITLHVGAGTFQPVKDDNIFDHSMHIEHFYVSQSELQKIIKNIDHIFAVGTTTTRTLESLYWIAVKHQNETKIVEDFLHLKQWDCYEINSEKSAIIVLGKLLNLMISSNLNEIKCSTQIMIIPTYTFKIINAIITNFHQPKSTLLLLISAIVGNDWKKIYEFASENNYRFLSYGDSSILFVN